MKSTILFFVILCLFSKAQNTPNSDELTTNLSQNQATGDAKLEQALNISENYLTQNLYRESMTSLFQAKKLAENTKSENLKAYTFILLANFYRGLELNKKASETLEMAMHPLSLINSSEKKTYIEARFLLEKGLLNFSLSKADEGKTNLWKSEKKFLSDGTSKTAAKSLQLIYSRLGDYYLAQNNLDSAKHYYSQNLNLSKQFPVNKELNLRSKNDFSKYYLQKKKYDSALFFVAEFSKILPSVKDLRLKKEIYKNMAQLHFSLDDSENYKTFNEQYLKINDSIYALDKETRVLLANEADSAQPQNGDTDRFPVLLIIVGTALAGLAFTFAHHLRVKREYLQFQKIMQNMKDAEDLKKSEVLTVSASNPYIISEKTEQIILDKLRKFEEGEKYINPKVSLQFLAKNLDTNTKYLSEIINKSKGQNFNNYINELRIHYILRKLKTEPKYQNYKVTSLAEECGFNSRNTFTLAFKNTLGMSPAKFISFIKKESLIKES